VTPFAFGRRDLLAPALFTLVGLVVLIGLGTWQLERRQWKESLMAALSERVSAAPTAVPPQAQWPALSAADWEFRRVTLRVEFLHEHEALVYSAGSALRADVTGPGYWVFTPARQPVGTLIMVNRGFVGEAQKHPGARPAGQVAGVQDIVGFMRWPEHRGMFTPAGDARQNLWFAREPAEIAAAKNLGPIAPFYIDQEGPTPPGGSPRPGALRVNLPNNHLQYAITWFGLAAALATVFVVWARGRRSRVPTAAA
jgi:surfeit locus 1 family protein